jgi:glycine cleavage system aminomethyltransferase T
MFSFPLYVASWYRKSPYWERTVEAGCKSWDLYNHMLIPTFYDDDENEYWHLLKHVTLWDVAVEWQVEITGPDATAFTQLLTCRDLSKCEVGQCKYAPLIAPDGGIVNDPILLRLGQDHFWLSLADSDALLYAKGVQALAGLEVTVQEPDVSPLQVQGPKSKPLIRDLFGEEVVTLRYYRCIESDLDGIPVVVSRTGWTGEVGYEIYLRDSSRGLDLWDRVMEAGRPHEIRAIAPSEQRRIEAGIFNYGSDMRVEDTPLHVTGLEKYIEWDQPHDFIGRQRLEQIRDDDLLDRKLVGIEIGGEPMTDEGALNDLWTLYQGDAALGRVTAGAWSPRLEKNIGYAWVPIRWVEPGSAFEADTPRGRVPVTVVPLPFVDPSKDIPKG